MKAISLKDLNPQGSKFTLRQAEREFSLRPINLRDEKWLQATFGNRLNKIFTEMLMLEVCRIAFHQLEEEDKKFFAKKELTLTNEEGESVTETIGGYELLFWYVSGLDEKMELFQSLMETIGVSRKMQKAQAEKTPEEIAAEKADAERFASLSEDEQLAELEKKRQTGPLFSIASPLSTDGPPSTSGAEL